MKVKIISDSTCDLSPALIEKYDIAVVPLYVLTGDQMRRDGLEEISIRSISRMLRRPIRSNMFRVSCS